MKTCSSCRRWRPIRGSLTKMVCSLIRTDSANRGPRIVLNLPRQKPTDYPMVLATPADFGCVLYEDRPADADRRQD